MQGLVHISQLSETRVEAVGDVVDVGDDVWVKVVGYEEDAQNRRKMRLSMKYCDQSDGTDKDASGANADADAMGRKGGGPSGANAGGNLMPTQQLEAVLNVLSPLSGLPVIGPILAPPISVDVLAKTVVNAAKPGSPNCCSRPSIGQAGIS